MNVSRIVPIHQGIVLKIMNHSAAYNLRKEPRNIRISDTTLADRYSESINYGKVHKRTLGAIQKREYDRNILR